jgi:hypothetical protein
MREMPMTHVNEIARLRTQLREVNIEYSALVRGKGDEDRFVRMDELKVRRLALMALIARGSCDPGPRAAPGKATMETAAQAA